MENIIQKNNLKNETNVNVPILLGYVIMRNTRFKVGTPSVNGTEWQEMESGFRIDYVKKKLYQYKISVDEAIEQLRKYNPDDDYESHPVYWYGR